MIRQENVMFNVVMLLQISLSECLFKVAVECTDGERVWFLRAVEIEYWQDRADKLSLQVYILQSLSGLL